MYAIAFAYKTTSEISLLVFIAKLWLYNYIMQKIWKFNEYLNNKIFKKQISIYIILINVDMNIYILTK